MYRCICIVFRYLPFYFAKVTKIITVRNSIISVD
jgi:hypothetical protein